MQAAINPYYLQVLEDMQNILKNSTPGKRRWTLDSVTGQPDYSLTERSTFPQWSKFFYETTPKKEQIKYLEVGSCKPYEDGYFNGNTKEFLRILRNSEDGILSDYPRINSAWSIAIDNYLSEIRDWEYENNQDYYDYKNLQEFPF